MEKLDKILYELQEIKQLLALQKEVLTVDEFVKYTSLSKHQVYHLTAQKKIKFYRPFGKLIFFHKDDVVDFLLSNPSNTLHHLHKQKFSLLNNKN